MNNKVYRLLSDFGQLKWRIAVKGILIGVLAGFLVVLYRQGIELGTQTAVSIYGFLRLHPVYIILWLAAILLAGVIIGRLVQYEPMASGSGIPQVEGVVLYGLKMKWHTILAVRYLGGILCSLFGLSLGREGPSIQIGASGAKLAADRLSKSELEKTCLITGGAAAGLSAAFNAPLSGIVFALEEVHRSFSPLILLAATTASLTADFVSQTYFGLRPVLQFVKLPQLPLRLYIWLLPLGILSGLIGSLMNLSLLRFQTLYRKIPAVIRPCIALLLALPCGLFLPEVLGGGANLIKISENVRNGIAFLIILLIIKILFTCTSFGSGVPGGIFLPILSAGALTGSILGLLASHFGFPQQFIPDLAVCAMAGVLSSCVKAPVTSILLTAEMAGSLVHMLPVAACSFLALFISDLLKIKPIYEALLERFVESNDDRITLNEKGGLHEYPVEPGCTICGKKISEITWPENSLIVGIRRGNSEIVPKGNIHIRTGDYLIILFPEDYKTDIRRNMEELCYPREP